MTDTATPTKPEPRTENGRGLSPFALIGEKGRSSKGLQAQPGYALLREQLWVLSDVVLDSQSGPPTTSTPSSRSESAPAASRRTNARTRWPRAPATARSPAGSRHRRHHLALMIKYKGALMPRSLRRTFPVLGQGRAGEPLPHHAGKLQHRAAGPVIHHNVLGPPADVVVEVTRPHHAGRRTRRDLIPTRAVHDRRRTSPPAYGLRRRS